MFPVDAEDRIRRAVEAAQGIDTASWEADSEVLHLTSGSGRSTGIPRRRQILLPIAVAASVAGLVGGLLLSNSLRHSATPSATGSAASATSKAPIAISTGAPAPVQADLEAATIAVATVGQSDAKFNSLVVDGSHNAIVVYRATADPGDIAARYRAVVRPTIGLTFVRALLTLAQEDDLQQLVLANIPRLTAEGIKVVSVSRSNGGPVRIGYKPTTAITPSRQLLRPMEKYGAGTVEFVVDRSIIVPT